MNWICLVIKVLVASPEGLSRATADSAPNLCLFCTVGKGVGFKLWRYVKTSNLSSLHKVSDLGGVFICEPDVNGTPIFFQILQLLRTRDGKDIVTLL